jgi:hypothetical protein
MRSLYARTTTAPSSSTRTGVQPECVPAPEVAPDLWRPASPLLIEQPGQALGQVRVADDFGRRRVLAGLKRVDGMNIRFLLVAGLHSRRVDALHQLFRPRTTLDETAEDCSDEPVHQAGIRSWLRTSVLGRDPSVIATPAVLAIPRL